jgi:hypothetical protein
MGFRIVPVWNWGEKLPFRQRKHLYWIGWQKKASAESWIPSVPGSALVPILLICVCLDIHRRNTIPVVGLWRQRDAGSIWRRE